MSHAATAVSAPGKVLLAGGYLVLEREYSGLVFGLDARIHVVVAPIRPSAGISLSEIRVQSPQFRDAVWEYGYRLAERDGGIEVTPLRVDADQPLRRNPFVETALAYALSYIALPSHALIAPARITILASSSYYSTPTRAASPPPRFHNFNIPLPAAHKTGLGSSAALVTALTAAILLHYLPHQALDISTDPGRRTLHNLAQAAHSAAQGKIGSGFDVAAAVYGGCLYRRFSPSVLGGHSAVGAAGFATQLRELVDGGAWDVEIRADAVRVPSGLRLVMCDVSGGSQTPGMVKRVLAWRGERPEEAGGVWRELQGANEGLARELGALGDGARRDYAGLKACLARIRRGLRLMSEKSGVPVEPPEQTELLDACEEVSGVVGGVVPGAGGYDAVALLIEDREEVEEGLRVRLEKWNAGLAGSEGGGRVSVLGVREEMEGVRVEDASGYQEWAG